MFINGFPVQFVLLYVKQVSLNVTAGFISFDFIKFIC